MVTKLSNTLFDLGKANFIRKRQSSVLEVLGIESLSAVITFKCMFSLPWLQGFHQPKSFEYLLWLEPLWTDRVWVTKGPPRRMWLDLGERHLQGTQAGPGDAGAPRLRPRQRKPAHRPSTRVWGGRKQTAGHTLCLIQWRSARQSHCLIHTQCLIALGVSAADSSKQGPQGLLLIYLLMSAFTESAF